MTTITTINNIVSSGVFASRPASPSLATPGAGSNPSVIYCATDTGDTYMWDFSGAAWIKINTGGGGGGGVMTQIGTTQTASGGATTKLTVSSIPNTAKHLRIMWYGAIRDTGNSSEGIILQLNGDTGNNYGFYQNAARNGVTVIAGNPATNGLAFGAAAQTGSSVLWSQAVGDILDYSSTIGNKTLTATTGAVEATLGALVQTYYSWWNNTAAITQIDILGNFADGSTFAVYGITG